MNEVESKRIIGKLQKKYPKKDGWTVQQREGKDKKKPDFLAERRNSDNKIERVVVDAKPMKKIGDKDVVRLNVYARNIAGGGSCILGKIFAVPKGVSAEKVPKGIEVLFYEQNIVVQDMPQAEAVIPVS
ncbi:hypothetical protein E2P71_06070 [Candidatus Bathyarchaeota archaeon]|nr:hypothetical protein E2P71_06070 [Candidatus Bathyarchaeota archaeon]